MAWSLLTSKEKLYSFAPKVTFPILVQNICILSSATMCVSVDKIQLCNFFDLAADIAADKPYVINKFIVNPKEIKFDVIVCNGITLSYATGEYLENTGVHSRYTTVILSAQKLYVNTICEVKIYASAIAKFLRITDLLISNSWPRITIFKSLNAISLTVKLSCL